MNCKNCTNGRYEIRGIRKCVDRYIEALEHSAHITSPVYDWSKILKEKA